MSVGTPFALTAADADPARPSARSRRRTPRAVVRWRLIKLRFALEGVDPSRQFGAPRGRNPRFHAVIGWPMRFRCLLAGGFAAACVAAAPAGASLNPQHAGLQVALRAQGLYLGPIDAIIGPKTVAAVRAFQRRHDLQVTGIADLRTRRELGPLGTPLFGSRTLAHGKFGWDVAVLQFLLNRHGVRVPVNAYLDKPTVAGIRSYQRVMHLRADGVAGPATFAALGLQSHVPVNTVKVTTLSRYVVKPGDSLTAIAHRHGTTLSRLAH